MYIAENMSYKARGKPILKEVSVCISPGTLTAIVGPNGAGKSTLLKVLTNEYTAQSGIVTINRKPIQHYSARELSLIRAVLSQHTQVNFPFSVREVVQLGCLPHRLPMIQCNAWVDQAMDGANILHLQERIYSSLSGGEQQRVQLARVMAQLGGQASLPRYVFLDEPTSSLDISHQHSILSMVKRLCSQNIGILAILHDLNLAAQYADRIVFLKDGAEIAQGEVPAIITKATIEKTFSHPVHLLHTPQTAIPLIVAKPLSLNQKNFKNSLITKPHGTYHD